MFQTINLETPENHPSILRSDQVGQIVRDCGPAGSLYVVFCPQTAVGLPIKADDAPSTVLDLRHELDRLVPTQVDVIYVFDTPSDAADHVKATLAGKQFSLIVHQNDIVLGSAQDLFDYGIDGPRRRQVYVKMIADPG